MVVDGFRRKKVAVVGSGSAGIAALWALNRTFHDVHLYEAADRLGGHTNTVQWKAGKYSTAVDTGFIALNTATYPNFLHFLERLGVQTQVAPVSFGLSRDHGAFEWSGHGLGGLFSQRKNLLSPHFWRMIFDVVRFNQFALDVLSQEEEEPPASLGGSRNRIDSNESIGQYLDREGYSQAFKDDYLIPLAASVWSMSLDKCALDFPAITLIRFFWNHHLLTTVRSRPDWLTLSEGSKSYIDAVMKGFPPNHLHLKTPVRHLLNGQGGTVVLKFENGKTEEFDHVVLATHGDEALSIIAPSATDLERSILSSFQTSQNEVVLHSDLAFMPKRRSAWSGWNFLTESSPSEGKANGDQVSLTYNMNILQGIPREPFGDVLVTLNPLYQPLRARVQGKFYYSQPLYTPLVIRAQEQLKSIQNTRGISYAGAWTKYGFHEDGFTSGLYVATEHLGAKLPFEFQDAAYARGRKPRIGLLDHLFRLFILLIQVFVIQTAERWLFRGPTRPKSHMNGRRKAANGKAITGAKLR